MREWQSVPSAAGQGTGMVPPPPHSHGTHLPGQLCLASSLFPSLILLLRAEMKIWGRPMQSNICSPSELVAELGLPQRCFLLRGSANPSTAPGTGFAVVLPRSTLPAPAALPLTWSVSWYCTADCMASSSFSSLSFHILFRFSHALFICGTQDCPQSPLGSSTRAPACSHLILSAGEAAGSPHLINALLHFWLLGLATGKDQIGPEEADELQLFVQPVCLLLDRLQRHSQQRENLYDQILFQNCPVIRRDEARRALPAPVSCTPWPTAQLQTPGAGDTESRWPILSPPPPPPAAWSAATSGTKIRTSAFSCQPELPGLKMLFVGDVLLTGAFCQYRSEGFEAQKGQSLNEKGAARLNLAKHKETSLLLEA